jgi:pancreatic triacylglycerol lipase
VGNTLADFIGLLITCKNVTTDSFQLIGHSLSANVCGASGADFNNSKIGRISGLYPAGPLLMINDSDFRLATTQTKLKVVSHTNKYGTGLDLIK